MATNLAPIYLDDARVHLQGDPKPRVSKIVAAGGKAVDGDLVVVRLRAQGDEDGKPVPLEEVIDRAQQSTPVYLRCLPGAGTQASAADEWSGLGAGPTLGRGRPGTGSTRRRPAAVKEPPQFGAARRGIAGQGATDSAGAVPADKQAKSDADPRVPRPSGRAQAPLRSREGDGQVTAADAD
jgi:hypothetical protein